MSGPVRVMPRELGVAGSLARDYTNGKPGATELFPRADGVTRADWSPAVSALTAETLQVAAGADDRLAAILAGDGCLVSTGQQPDLFLGPMYVLYKALTALETARRIETRTGRPSLPIFWVASDDHDWKEVARTRVIRSQGEVREIRIEPDAGVVNGSVGPSSLPTEVESAIEALGDAVGRAAFWDSYAAILREAYAPGRTYAEAFISALSGILEGREFVWLDSGLPAVRRASAELYREVLADPEPIDAAIGAGTAAVAAAGYEPQLRHVPGSPPVFIDTADGRVRLRRDGDGYRAGNDGAVWSRSELLSLLEAEPIRFTPAAALRPVLESRLLPVTTTVLGPGEIAYWAQLGPLFHALGTDMPRVRPRNAWLIVDDRARALLEKVGGEPADLADGGEALTGRLVASGRPESVDSALASLREGIERGMTDLDAAIGAGLPGVRASVGKAGKGFRSGLSELQKAIDRKVREEQEAVLAKIKKVASGLFPSGAEQERVQSPFFFLVREGPDLIDALERAGAETTEETS